MQYNIHPIIVHFPIAFLFIYAVIAILPFRKWFPKVAWRDISLAVLIIGFLGALAALGTGETAAHLLRRYRQIIQVHSMFASLSTWLFGVLLAGEVVAAFNRSPLLTGQKWAIVRKVTGLIEKFLYNTFLSKVIAILALISITVTGILGGVLVYGTTADPLAAPLLKLFGLSI